MVHVAEPVVTVAKPSPAKAAAAVTDEVGDDAADSYEADDTDDEAKPFRVRSGEGQRCRHDAAAR